MNSNDSKLIKAATNEYALLGYRAFGTVCLTALTWYAADIRSSQGKLTSDLSELKTAYVERIAKVEGEVGALRGSVETHRRRLDGNDSDIRAIWSRFYDFNLKNQQPRGTP